MNKYSKEVTKRWGNTSAYKGYAEKTKNYTESKWQQVNDTLNESFSKFNECKNIGLTADSDQAQALVKMLQSHISENYYTCTNEILKNLGVMYVSDERFKANIDKQGSGTATFVNNAIEIYCKTS